MKHFLNGTEITPRNLDDMGISVDFSKDVQQESINIDSVIIPSKGKEIVMNHLNSIGISEGIPYEVSFSGKKLPYYVDLLESLKVRTNEVEVRIKQRYAHDNFIENADSLTFDYLNSLNALRTYDLKYRIIQQEALFKSLVITTTIYAISRTLQDQVRELAKTSKEFASIIAYGFSATGKIVEASIQLGIQIAYIGILVYQIKKLASDMKELIFPKTRTYKACKVVELLKAGCEHLGYTFKSTIFEGSGDYINLAVVSTPQNKEKKGILDYLESDLNFAFNTGYPTITDTTPTLGSLIKAMQTMFNARIKVRNKIVEFERWDYWIDQAQGSVKVALPIQDSAVDEFEIDTERNFKRYLIQYQVDYSDMTTLDEYANTVSEYSAERNTIINQDLNLIKGLTNASIPFAKAKRKTSVNWLEKQYIKLLKEIDGSFGTNYANAKNPIGIMEVTSQYFSVAKLVIIDGAGKMYANDKLFPSVLWDKYHSVNNPNLHTWIIRKKVPTAMTEEQFLQLLDNNYAQINGTQCEILSLEYLPMQNRALLDYKQKVKFYKQNVSIQKIY
jgi:hypothetical protein